MKTSFLSVTVFVSITCFLSSCFLFKPETKKSGTTTDIVCKMKISNITDAYSYKYKGETYYFDSYNCKEAFKMNPEKFISGK